jgi:hypothetical protein
MGLIMAERRHDEERAEPADLHGIRPLRWSR